MIIDFVIVHTTSGAVPDTLGVVQFQVADHDNVDYYEARLRAQGSSTVLATLNIGKPDYNASRIAYYNLASWLNSQAAGNYSVSIAAVNTDGTTDSLVSNDFTVPLA